MFLACNCDFSVSSCFSIRLCLALPDISSLHMCAGYAVTVNIAYTDCVDFVGVLVFVSGVVVFVVIVFVVVVVFIVVVLIVVVDMRSL